MKRVLITGGAGYIGLNMALELIKKDISITIVDDMKNSYREHIDSLISLYPDKISFVEGDVCNISFMEDTIRDNNFDSIIHLSARKYVGESFKQKDEYMRNNLESLRVVLDLMGKYDIKNLMFASSVTVYGNATTMHEDGILSPISPYAESKKLGEDMIHTWYKSNSEKNILIFRFANPMGANTEYNLGNHPKSGIRNLIGELIHHALSSEPLILHGNNHPTIDGTPVRDFIHILDLARISMDIFTSDFKGLHTYNLGRGKGYSVLEMLHMAEEITSKKINFSFGERIMGDVSIVETNIEKIAHTYNIKFTHDLEDMVVSEYEFYKQINHINCN